MDNTMMDDFFNPDIRIVVKGDKSVILSAVSLTYDGTLFLKDNNHIKGLSYDDIDFQELCIEVIDN